MKLVIVESPSKTKTIEKYLGKDYKVVSSKGHIRDLATTGQYGFGIDIENDFTPSYKSAKGKSPVIKELKKEVLNSDYVYLATDPDREGEAISWHLFDALEIEEDNYERVIFNEITKDAVLKAFENPSKINDNLVKSQETRRMLDRIIGFRLSKLMQSKTGGKSAGRVQSVALKLIVDREREIEAFIPDEYWTITAIFKDFESSLEKYRGKKLEITGEHQANEILDSLSKSFNIEDLTRYRAEAKGLYLKIKIAPDIPMFLYGDVGNVKKIILNLVINAIKYTKVGFVELTVNCVLKNDLCRMIISVEDSGRGIKREDIDKLFKRFSRLDKDRNTTTEGTGLGLAITKHLSNLMGGDCTLVETEYGKGSKFTATINQGLKEIKDENNEIVDSNESVITNNNVIDLTDKKILIVDDNKLNIKVVTKFLEKYNCKVYPAISGDECISIIKNGEIFDLILMDEMMPNMTGTETMKKLKNNNCNVPIVVFTADEIAGKKESYIAEGFDEFLGKPILKEEFEKVMKKFLGTNN